MGQKILISEVEELCKIIAQIIMRLIQKPMTNPSSK